MYKADDGALVVRRDELEAALAVADRVSPPDRRTERGERILYVTWHAERARQDRHDLALADALGVLAAFARYQRVQEEEWDE